jgi:sugar/nucleoside kinase (ribokinase family)
LEPGTEPPEFVAVGHVTHDLVNGKTRLGGAALYSAVTAFRLGKRTALFTSYGEDYQGREAIREIPSQVVPAARTSTFRNIYTEEGRVQAVYSTADPLAVRDFPESWRGSGIVYLCPVLHEVPLEMGSEAGGGLLGVAPQGWMRAWDKEGRIRARRWEGFEPLLRSARCFIASEKDIEGYEDLVGVFRQLTPIVIITRAEQGADIYLPDRTLHVGAYPAEERDPTGAGDCFGAAFLIRYGETGDVEASACFASCVGSFVVEGEGIQCIPVREDVLRRMERHTVPCREETAERVQDFQGT